MVNWSKNIVKIALPTPFAVGDVNVYLVKGDALTLFDTGVKTEESKEVLIHKLGELGLKIKDIEQVILTHHHPDHAGALSFFEQDVPVYGHQNNQRWLDWSDEFIEIHNRFFLDYAQECGVVEELREGLIDYRDERPFVTTRKLSGFLAEGDSLPGLPGWTVIETLGHAQSHVSFYHEKDGVLIGGDHLLAKISPNPIIEPPLLPEGERPRPLLQYNKSLKKLCHIPISLVYSGHGAEVEDVNELIEFRLNRQHNRAMQVKKMLQEQPLTAFEICQQLFPKVYRKEVHFTMSETIGQLDYLEDLGEVQSEIQSGLTLFSIA
jgi:glyoxylase-like metal-dependent hydrolase (beta-lactamase superfamily II)